MSDKILKIAVCTLGCRVNQYESRAMSEYLESHGAEISDFDSVCDAYIINTCAVTAESERKSRQMARRAHKLNPQAAIIMTGCQSQLHPEEAAELPGVKYVGGNASKLDAARAALGAFPAENGSPVFGNFDIGKTYENYSVKIPDHTRAYIKIEDGCGNRCAYCVIPKVRGPVRSKAPEDVIKEAENVASLGYKEIVLTGIETCSYQYGLTELISRLSETAGIERIRLSSVNPSFINRRFTDRIKNLSKFCPHFHLSLQSFCDKTLNAMRRRYNCEMIFENCAYIRESLPDVCFTADMICGFPGESEKDFETTLKNTSALKLLSAHIFPYSNRPGTEASTMSGQLSAEIRNKRCALLRKTVRESGNAILKDFTEKGKIFPVLFETEKSGYIFGHTANFIEVQVKNSPDDRILPGSIRQVRLTGTKNGTTANAIII